jgi:hypothetical protein
MVHKKYSYKNGKKYGPYFYENKRVGEKVVTTYIGKEEERRLSFINIGVLILIIAFCFGLFYLFSFSLTGNVILGVTSFISGNGTCANCSLNGSIEISNVHSNNTDANLVSYWQFTNDARDSKGIYNLSVFNGVSKEHERYFFDGVDDYMNVECSFECIGNCTGTARLTEIPGSLSATEQAASSDYLTGDTYYIIVMAYLTDWDNGYLVGPTSEIGTYFISNSGNEIVISWGDNVTTPQTGWIVRKSWNGNQSYYMIIPEEGITNFTDYGNSNSYGSWSTGTYPDTLSSKSCSGLNYTACNEYLSLGCSSSLPDNSNCSQFGNAEDCDAYSSHGGQCASNSVCSGNPNPSCSGYGDEAGCNANSNGTGGGHFGGCTWAGANNCTGTVSCSQLATQEDCNWFGYNQHGDLRCNWYPGSYGAGSCGNNGGPESVPCSQFGYNNQNDCELYSGHNGQCTWHAQGYYCDGNVLTPSCDVFPDQSSCNKESFCGWAWSSCSNVGEGLTCTGQTESQGCSLLSGCYVNVTSGFPFVEDMNWSVFSWIKTSASSGNIFSIGDNGKVFSRLSIFGTGRMETIYYNPSSRVLSSVSRIDDNKWHHVGLSYNGTHLSMFVDGVLNSNALTDPIEISCGSGFSAGYKPGSASNFFGRMDEIKVYNRSLNSSEVLEMYNSGLFIKSANYTYYTSSFYDFGALKHFRNISWNASEMSFADTSSGLMGYYKFENNTLDSSGRGMNATLGDIRVVCDFNPIEQGANCTGSELAQTNLSVYLDCPSYCSNIQGTTCFISTGNSVPFNCRCYNGGVYYNDNWGWWGRNCSFVNGSAYPSNYTSGKFGQAFKLDGRNNTISVNGFGFPLLDNPESAFAWIKTSYNSTQGIFSHGTYTASGYNRGLSLNVAGYNGYVLFTSGGNGANYNCAENASGNVADGNWHHVGYVYSGKGSLILYVDGIGYLCPMASFDTRWGPFKIGYGVNDGHYFNGSIDEVLIYNRSLSSIDVAQIYENSTRRVLFEVNNITLQVRTASNSTNTATYSVWSSLLTNSTHSALSVSSGRYLQFRVFLNTNYSYLAPVLNSIALSYLNEDLVPPLVNIVSPNGSQIAPIIFNVSLDESGEVRFSLNNGVTNYTMSSLDGMNFNYTNSSIALGDYVMKVYANDTLGNRNYTESRDFTVILDSIPPLVNITSPGNGSYVSPISFNVTLNEIGSVKFSLDSGATNYTMSSLNNLSFNYTNSTIVVGSYTLRVYANDTLGNRNHTESRDFTVIPNASLAINFISPTMDNGASTNNNFILSLIEANGTNYKNYSYYLYNSTGLVDYNRFYGEDMGVSAKWDHTCALLNTGNITCWGLNTNGSSNNYTLGNAISVSAGDQHTCALLNTGNITCWGADSSYGETKNYTGGNALSISTADQHTCALLNNGNITCWGRNLEGQSNNYTKGNAISVSSGGGHTCALLNNGNITCWGSNSNGQSNNYTKGNAISVSTGNIQTCALLNTGNITCWGSNTQGQSNNYTLGNVISVSAGLVQTCALLNTGNITCWGYNVNGESNNYTKGNVIGVSTGIYHTCALLNNGNITCWGLNSNGQSNNYTLGNAKRQGLYAFLGLANGTYYLNASACDASNNCGWSETRTFTIDSVNPLVRIVSPSGTYTSNSYNINITLNEAGYCEYSLNNGVSNSSLSAGNSNKEFTSSVSGVSNGGYTLRAYCNDSAGNRNYSESKAFSVSVSSGSGSGSGGGGGGGGGGTIAPVGTPLAPEATYSASSEQIQIGYRQSLNEKESVKFSVKGNEHLIVLDRINSEVITVTISSVPQVINISLGKQIDVDVDEDNIKDVSVGFWSIKDGKAEIFVRLISSSQKVNQTKVVNASKGNTAILNNFNLYDYFDIKWVIGLIVAIALVLFAIYRVVRRKVLERKWEKSRQQFKWRPVGEFKEEQNKNAG